jgi:hypothetical protein
MDVRMMLGALCLLGNPIDEAHRGDEVGESELSLDEIPHTLP